MSARPDARGRAHPYRPLSHPAGRRFRRAARADDDAARPQRRRQDDDAAHHHGPVARLARRDRARRARRSTALRDARHRARSASPTCRRRWRSSPTSRCARTCVLGARDGPLDEARLALDLRLLPGAEEDSGCRARARCRAGRSRCCRSPAPSSSRAAAADRRADQGPRAGDRRRADRLPAGDQARRGATILLVEQNFRVAREVGDDVRGDGQRPHRPRGAMAALAADDGAAEPAARPLAWSRINERARRRRRAAARAGRHPAGADAADRRAGRRAVHRLALDLRDADARGPGDGHDDLHHGLGPDAGLRHDGRAQFRPRRLHRARRLCRDAGAAAAGELGAGRFAGAQSRRASLLALLAAARRLRRARLRLRARADRRRSTASI